MADISKEDIKSVKVSDLKKELKSRGLSIGGNKSELYARLQAAVDSEKDDENDEDLLGEDILDEVLKNTEANNKPDSEADKLLDEAILATSSEESLTQTTKSDSDTTTQPKTKIRKLDTDTIIKSPETTTTRLKPKLTKTISPVINVETKDQTSDTSQSPEKADNPTGDAAKIVKASAIKILTAEERALLRAQKFGQVDKLKTRAERFGTEKAANNKIGKISKEDVDPEKLQKRIERFGCVSATVKKTEDQEKLKKRAEKFGSNLIRPGGGSASESEARMKRLKRFGATV